MEFDAQKIREEQQPKITRSWMAKKLRVHYMFLQRLEFGIYPWPAKLRNRFERVIAEWQANPPRSARDRRSDFGTRRPKLTRKGKGAPVVQGVPVPVPHSHGEVVGIG